MSIWDFDDFDNDDVFMDLDDNGIPDNGFVDYFNNIDLQNPFDNE